MAKVCFLGGGFGVKRFLKSGRLFSWVGAAAMTLALFSAVPLRGDEPEQPAMPITWRSEYRDSMDLARTDGKMMLLWFYDKEKEADSRKWEQEVLESKKIRPLLDEMVLVRVPTDLEVSISGTKQKLLHHVAFAEMLRHPGLAMIDMRRKDSPFYGLVVTVFPFNRGPIDAEKLEVLLTLPAGSLTQRTMIYAVRTHRERPESASSDTSHLLLEETRKHSFHQASINLQGHHNWENRFHQINAQLPAGLVATEVCAESWPGQTLVEAAEECVHSWRQSPGHWSSVRERHPLFGFDIKRGRNGVWYATGIFAKRH